MVNANFQVFQGSFASGSSKGMICIDYLRKHYVTF